MRRSVPAIAGLVALVVVASLFAACEPQPPAADPTARAYAASWVKGDYQAMWDLLTDESKAKVGQVGFIARLPRIAEEMTETSLEATVGQAAHLTGANGSPDPRRATATLRVTFHTQRVGTLKRDTFLSLLLTGEKEKAAWKIDWTPEAILPHLVTGRLVRMTRLATTRGRIIARDGTELATFTDAAVVGVVPEQIKNEAGMLASLASVLGLKADEIKAKYNASWVRPDSFVPIRTLTGDAFNSLRARLTVIEGVQLQAQRVRSYPTGLASQLLGFLGEASDADAQKRTARGFAAGGLIGKNGLAQQLDDVLGGGHGWGLSIVDPDERPVELLGETAPIAGNDAVLSLDPPLQAAAGKGARDQKGAILSQ